MTLTRAALAGLVGLLSACGGGGGGGGGGSVPLAAGSFTKSFGPVSTGSNGYPFMGGSDVKQQILYLASEINGSGTVKTLRLQLGAANAASQTCPNTTIKLGHTSVTALVATFASNVEVGQGSLATVFNNATLTIPAGAANTWFDIPLTTPFEYNGKDNLVAEITHVSGCSANVGMGGITAASNRRANSSALDATPGASDIAASGANSLLTASLVDANQLLMQFVFSGGDNTVWYGNTGGNAYPLWVTNRTQMLHPAAAVSGSGPITGIGMVVDAATTAAQTFTATIRLGHSTLTSLGATFASNYSSAPVTVASNLVFTVPAGVPAGSTLWLPVNGSFSYNGTDNLIVDIDVSAATAGTVFWRVGTSSANLVRAIGASAGTTATTPPDAVTYDTLFRFHGGKVVVLPLAAGSMSAQVLGNGGAGQLQSLYTNTLIGSSGTIQNVYVRLSAPSVAATLANYKLYMGHTAKTTYLLADTYASNMTENAVVMSGSLPVPAGLKAGDWVKIPLSAPFAYDSAKNLSVLFTTDISSAAGNNVSVRNDGAQFPAAMVGRNDNAVPSTGTPAWNYNGIVDLQLDMTK